MPLSPKGAPAPLREARPDSRRSRERAQGERTEGRRPSPGPGRTRAQEVFRRLRDQYGPRRWSPRRGPLEELVFTVLSQNTSDANALRTYASLLRRFPSWEAVAAADLAGVAEAIRLGGLSRVKAPRIQAILRAIQRERGGLDLSFLAQMPLAEAKAWLRGLPGVGPKTAACVLLFSFGRPALPVDTHVHRVARRLGLIGPRTTAEQAHDELEALVAPERVYRVHMDLIEHGRSVCKAPRPRCAACVLNALCPSSTVRALEAAAEGRGPRERGRTPEALQ